MDAWLEVEFPDGTREHHPLAGPQVTLGRSAAAGIPLVNRSELLPEHLLLAPRRKGCWVAAAHEATLRPQVGGELHEKRMVRWGSEMVLGALTLRLLDEPPATRGERTARSPVLLFAALSIPLIAWLFLDGGEPGMPGRPSDPPPVVGAEAPACELEGERARSRAQDAAEAASRRAERYPFDPQEGVVAARLWSEAASCYERAERSADAARVRRSRETLIRKMQDEYRVQTLRLERALQNGRDQDGYVAANQLLAMLQHQADHPYAQWVTLVERRLGTRMAARVSATDLQGATR